MAARAVAKGKDILASLARKTEQRAADKDEMPGKRMMRTLVFHYKGRCRGNVALALSSNEVQEFKQLQRVGPDSFTTSVAVPHSPSELDVVEVEYYIMVDGCLKITHPRSGSDDHGHHYRVILPGDPDLLEFHHSGYSFDSRVASSYSQYSVPLPASVPHLGAAGASACTSIACTFIHRVLLAERGPTTAAELDQVLVEGIGVHMARQSLTDGAVQHMAADEVLLLDPKLSQLLSPEGMAQGQQGVDRFLQVTAMLQPAAVGSPNGWAAAALTTQFMTVAVLAQANQAAALAGADHDSSCSFALFDSHSYNYGDDLPDGATYMTFNSARQLQQFLCERFATEAEDFMLDVYEATLVQLKPPAPPNAPEVPAAEDTPAAPGPAAEPTPALRPVPQTQLSLAAQQPLPTDGPCRISETERELELAAAHANAVVTSSNAAVPGRRVPGGSMYGQLNSECHGPHAAAAQQQEVFSHAAVAGVAAARNRCSIDLLSEAGSAADTADEAAGNLKAPSSLAAHKEAYPGVPQHNHCADHLGSFSTAAVARQRAEMLANTTVPAAADTELAALAEKVLVLDSLLSSKLVAADSHCRCGGHSSSGGSSSNSSGGGGSARAAVNAGAGTGTVCPNLFDTNGPPQTSLKHHHHSAAVYTFPTSETPVAAATVGGRYKVDVGGTKAQTYDRFMQPVLYSNIQQLPLQGVLEDHGAAAAAASGSTAAERAARDTAAAHVETAAVLGRRAPGSAVALGHVTEAPVDPTWEHTGSMPAKQGILVAGNLDDKRPAQQGEQHVSNASLNLCPQEQQQQQQQQMMQATQVQQQDEPAHAAALAVPTAKGVADALQYFLAVEEKREVIPYTPPPGARNGSLLRYFCKQCLMSNKYHPFTYALGADDVLEVVEMVKHSAIGHGGLIYRLPKPALEPAFACKRERLLCAKLGDDPGLGACGQQLLTCGGPGPQHVIGVLQNEHPAAQYAAGAYVFLSACHLVACEDQAKGL